MRLPSCIVVLGLVATSITAQAMPALAGHCHKCKHYCCCCYKGGPAGAPSYAPQERQAAPATAAFPQAQLVPSMAMYQMPMMYASVPIMPAMASFSAPAAQPAAAPTTRETIRDCCDRVDSLETEMKRLAQSVNNMQILIQGQNDILKALVEDRNNNYMKPALPARESPPAAK